MMKRPPIDQMKEQIAAIDPNPWRAQFDELGDLIIWFHAELAQDPRRIIVSMDEKPSKNEKAAAAFLVHCREYVKELINYIETLEALARPAAGAGKEVQP